MNVWRDWMNERNVSGDIDCLLCKHEWVGEKVQLPCCLIKYEFSSLSLLLFFSVLIGIVLSVQFLLCFCE